MFFEISNGRGCWSSWFLFLSVTLQDGQKENAAGVTGNFDSLLGTGWLWCNYTVPLSSSTSSSLYYPPEIDTTYGWSFHLCSSPDVLCAVIAAAHFVARIQQWRLLTEGELSILGLRGRRVQRELRWFTTYREMGTWSTLTSWRSLSPHHQDSISEVCVCVCRCKWAFISLVFSSWTLVCAPSTDVINRLHVLRGRAMVGLYSWSSKR